jgi:hypothetical protein
MKIKSKLLILAVLGACASGAITEPLRIGDFSRKANQGALPDGWELREKFGRANFSLCQVDGYNALGLRSTNTSFCLQREVNADLAQYPILSWKWKVTKLPERGDFRSSKTDDQAAQLFVAFSKTQFIVYIWDTTAPEGYAGDAHTAPFITVKVVVVRSSPAQSGKWLTETRNVAQDYRQLYGGNGKPPVVRGVRLQINTQHTRSSAESYFADLAFQQQL